jgi:hypothetical protein
MVILDLFQEFFQIFVIDLKFSFEEVQNKKKTWKIFFKSSNVKFWESKTIFADYLNISANFLKILNELRVAPEKWKSGEY